MQPNKLEQLARWHVVFSKQGNYLLRILPGNISTSGGYFMVTGRGYSLPNDVLTLDDIYKGFEISKEFIGPLDFRVGRVIELCEVTVKENSANSTTKE